MKGGLDYIVLKSLDTDGIRIISSVLGQSIALDHYIRQVLILCEVDELMCCGSIIKALSRISKLQKFQF